MALILVLLVFILGLVVYFAIETKNSSSYSDGKVPYSNLAPGLLYEMTPQSILDNNDLIFWSENKLAKKQFYIETKFGQSKGDNNLFNYTISDAEDCEREFDKKNYVIPIYYQKTGIGPEKYNMYPARSCWIENIAPINLECLSSGTEETCLYSCKVSCVCIYATEN